MRLIDADALIDRMYHEAFETDSEMQKWDSGCWIRYKMFENAIDDAPTIEPKRGEWIDRSGGIEGAWNYCSVCGEQAIDLYDFCPNCGADAKKDTRICVHCGTSLEVKDIATEQVSSVHRISAAAENGSKTKTIER